MNIRVISLIKSLQLYLSFSEARGLDGMTKMWLRDLKDETEEQIQGCFIFKNNLVGSFNHIFCSLSIYASPIIDGFSPFKVKDMCATWLVL